MLRDEEGTPSPETKLGPWTTGRTPEIACIWRSPQLSATLYRPHTIYTGGSAVKKIYLPRQKTQEMWVQFLSWEDTLEEERASPSSTVSWETPRTQEPDRLQSMGSESSQIGLRKHARTPSAQGPECGREKPLTSDETRPSAKDQATSSTLVDSMYVRIHFHSL